jgi:hypothetical protein
MRQRKTNRERGREGFHLASGITNKCCHKKILSGLVGVGKGGEGSQSNLLKTHFTMNEGRNNGTAKIPFQIRKMFLKRIRNKM